MDRVIGITGSGLKTPQDAPGTPRRGHHHPAIDAASDRALADLKSGVGVTGA